MPQSILPLIPHGATNISEIVSVYREQDHWFYYVGLQPVFSHKTDDQILFKIITSQLIDSGACRQVDIINAFGVSKSKVTRSLRKLREQGVEAFFEPRKKRCGGKILTPEVLEKAQSLLDQGYPRYQISKELGVKEDTLRKAINDGRLQEQKKSQPPASKSARNEVDAAAAEGMGTACTRVDERVFASFGICDGAPVRFESCLDVPNGGVLCALPALLLNGLLKNAEELLGQIKGYYTTFHILLLLAFMALCRIKTVEKLGRKAPGEFGKLLGLDRIPEVRCLRKKLDALSCENAAEKWAMHLSRDWMENDPEAAGTLYIDGHVRVYHGKLTKLPRRFVSRERLCLRGTTDYWVNDGTGQPFFVVEKPVDPGLIATLKTDIVPRLIQDVPDQPTRQELKDNPYLCRFIMVFDREGYSPEFFSQMWQDHRVACITYHKYPDDTWPEDEFKKHEAKMPGGEVVEMNLAERGSLIGSGKKKIWVREVRKLTESGHQTSVISTAYELIHIQSAARMFSRWCQENFFRYMKQHFAIDTLSEYGIMDLPDTETVISPSWRNLNRQRNSVQNKLRYRRACFTALTMHPAEENDPEKYNKWLNQKAELLEQIEQYENELETLKSELKNTPKHIAWGELKEDDKFYRLLPGRKRLVDTVRMIAYRAETAMAGLLIDATVDLPAARGLLQELFVTEADIIPEPDAGLLRIRIHNASRPASNRALIRLFEQLNAAEVEYPGTEMRIYYELGGIELNATPAENGITKTSQR
jgi:hypothetical protein